MNGPQHKQLPRLRAGLTHAFEIGEIEGYLITGEYEDGSLGQVFIYAAKQGSTLRGLLDNWATSVSLGLQHGVPLETYVEKFVGQRFEPHGMTGDEDVKNASSIGDYIFRRLALDYLAPEVRRRLGVDYPQAETASPEGD
jgi:ribonucleoside-diphosphate reductase alpha chain